MHIKVLTRISLFAALAAAMAQIILPLPFSPVPVSMATLAVMLCGGLLPPRQAWWAMVVYLLLGGMGLPVFSGFAGGVGRLLGPTGGYLLAYPFAALGASVLVRRLGSLKGGCLVGMAAASVLCCAFGALWLGFSEHLSIRAALLAGVLPFLPAEAAKVFLAALLTQKLRIPLAMQD